MKTLKHEEIGGDYSNKRKIIIDACEISSGEFSVMALYENGEELEEIKNQIVDQKGQEHADDRGCRDYQKY